MIPQPDLELLTQAVDGELSAREARHLRRLLVASPEARVLYEQLQSQRQRLQNLPRLAPPANLTGRVLARVAHMTPAPHPVRPSDLPVRRFSFREAWVPISVAASLLVALSGATYWFAVNTPNNAGSYARNPSKSDAAVTPQARAAWRAMLPHEAEPLPSRPVERETPTPLPTPPRPRPQPSPEVVVQKPEVIAPPRVVTRDDALTAPLIGKISPFDTVRVRLPFLASLSEIKDKAEAREALARELQRDSARLDLFSHDVNKGLDHVISALRSHGVTVHVDAVARERHRPKRGPAPPTAFVLYVECLNATEIRDLLAKLATNDAKQSLRVFDMLHLASIQSSDHKELKDLLGADVGQVKKPDAGSMPKGIGAGTADQVARTLAGGAVGKGPAIVLTHAPPSARAKPAASKEIQHFLSKRGDHKPASLPFMIVVRSVN